MSSIETASAEPAPSINPYLALRQRVFRWGRAQVAVPVAVAVVGPGALAAIGLAVHIPGALLAALVLVPTPILEALLALQARREWTAQEVLGWLDWTTLELWAQRTEGRRPRSAIEAQAWLVGHGEASVPAVLRASMLILAGRLTEARDVIAALPDATPRARRERLELELDADAFGHRSLDVDSVDDAVRADVDQSPAEKAARLAYHAALAAVARGGDGLAELAMARPAIGRLPADLRRRLWLGRLTFAVLALVLEVWILVAILVALSTASGLVLY
ncbi:MAG TPA: hypothetical protein VIK06_11090 [Candidatus Limnocylindrales bacterium]